jgi:hypothetical protein
MYSPIAWTDRPPLIWRTQLLPVIALAIVCLLIVRLGTKLSSVGAIDLTETPLIQLSNQKGW